MSRSFLTANIPDLVDKLSLDEKISLLGAPNWWNTSSIDRLEIPSVRMSDGPNGVRGSSHFIQTPAQCLPSATSLAATFDPALVHKVGVFLAEEAKIKSSVILLAPTCNIQRSPLGGRSFESFSEDPYLSGTMAAAYVNGLQSEGVAATIKHFVANDQESERTAADSVMSDRALREIYLYPFMIAMKDSQPKAFMTSYGRLYGVHCSESPALLQGILRGEWGFNGAVISDWHGTYGTDQGINAGLDLEMPGPPRWRTPNLIKHALTSQKLLTSAIDKRVENLLAFIQRQAQRNPEVVYGDGVERSRDSPEARDFARKLAADGIVLLKNEGDLLPLRHERVKRLAIIGPNAKERVISGGGSAFLKPTYVITPFAGISAVAYEGLQVDYAVGCYAHKYLPTLESKLTTPDGESGWTCTFHSADEDGKFSDPVATFTLADTRVKLNDFLPPGLPELWYLRLEGKLTVDTTGPFELGLTVAGRAKLWVNGELTIDNWTKQTPGDFFYGQGTIEEKAVIDTTAGTPVNIRVEYSNVAAKQGDGDSSSQPALMRGVRLGGCEKIDAEQAIQAAVSLASDSDAVLFVAGLSPEWESEGFDRPSLALPGLQDEAISRISAANPNTIVVVQAGSAVSMPWVTGVNGLLQSWYSGNEAGNALADILFGKVNPSGRMPLTFPVQIEDIPAFNNLRSENGQIHYREDLFVGYKHYLSRKIKPLFAFGFGLSYTSFSISDLSVEGPASWDQTLSINVGSLVKNEGPVPGSQVVQVYVSYPDLGITHPPLQLRGFAKSAVIASGATEKLVITLDKLAVSFWDSTRNAWCVAAGKYAVHVGFSSDNILLREELEVKKTFYWKGL